MHENTKQIIVKEVSKTVKGRVVLDKVTLELEQGGVYGFYGVNGSGKTMLFRAIAGLIKIDEGEISVFGEQIGKDSSFPHSLGLIIESVGLWDEYTGLVNLKMLASIKNEIGEDDIRSAIKRVGLDPDDKRTYKKYSLGMKQRIAIAQAIMERPELIILDEPTNALDEDGKQLIHDIIIEEKKRGATVLIASHDHEELASLSDRQFKMYEGKLSEG
jgi:ABC-2 type transport system ATP-binding protein